MRKTSKTRLQAAQAIKLGADVLVFCGTGRR